MEPDTESTTDDIYKQIFKLAWDQQPVRVLVITYLTFNVLILAMITVILWKVIRK